MNKEPRVWTAFGELCNKKSFCSRVLFAVLPHGLQAAACRSSSRPSSPSRKATLPNIARGANLNDRHTSGHHARQHSSLLVHPGCHALPMASCIAPKRLWRRLHHQHRPLQFVLFPRLASRHLVHLSRARGKAPHI